MVLHFQVNPLIVGVESRVRRTTFDPCTEGPQVQGQTGLQRVGGKSMRALWTEVVPLLGQQVAGSPPSSRGYLSTSPWPNLDSEIIQVH